MSGESTALPVASNRGPASEFQDLDVQAVLEALADPDCRCVLRAVAEEPLTASECVNACGIPLSTTYRKLEILAAAGLVDERLRLRRDGKHASEYRRRVDSVCVGVEDDGTLEVVVSGRSGPLGTERFTATGGR